MANLNSDAFQSSADLSLWFKVRSGDPLNLADLPEVIPLRWQWFRDTWNFIKGQLLNTANAVDDPDYFRTALNSFTDFIQKQRSAPLNPLSGSELYFQFYPVFDQLLVEQISLTNEEQALVDARVVRVTQFSRNDFLRIKQDIAAYRDHLSDLCGLGDPDYDRIYARGVTTAQVEASNADLNLMLLLQQQLSAVDFVLANLFAVDALVDPFALAKANANNPEVNIGQYSSGFLVKLHYREDLQSLAARYLGNPDKWIDIAIANGLKEPYIDEVGEQIFFLANGSGNQINLPGLDASGNSNLAKLSINQRILIESDGVGFPSERTVTAIKQIPISQEILITVDGDSNLNTYLRSDQARIRVFKPNTINSSQFILIPSVDPAADSRAIDVPWFLASSQVDERQTKIDIAIDDNGSLQFTANGDIALSYGLANAIQAIKLKLLTELGTNRRHPEFGLINVLGGRNLSPEEVKRKIIQSITAQVDADARFDRIETIKVQQTSSGPVGYTIDLTVRLAGGTTSIPISFSVAT